MRGLRLLAADGFAPPPGLLPGLLVVEAGSALPPGGTAEEAVDTLARTLWGEARGEPVRGLEAVAAVVMNRVHRARLRGGYWWGGSVVAVCRAPEQFACWTPGDPNYAAQQSVLPGEPVFGTCLRIARRTLAGVLPDPTAGATHYHADSSYPGWARSRVPCAEIGSLLFYNDVE